MRRAILENFRQDTGTSGISFGDRAIKTLPADKLATFIKTKKPWARRNWLKTLRGLFRFAVAEKLRPDDPTKDIKLTVVKTKGFHSWTEAEIAQYRRATQSEVAPVSQWPCCSTHASAAVTWCEWAHSIVS